MRHYRGRFAPTPSGPLHFGSLVAAVASYLDARHHQGDWFVRIDDLDQPRQKPGSVESILATLEALGFEWDDEIQYQSRRTERYQALLDELSNRQLVYPCSCSRKEIAAEAKAGVDGLVYPGTCRSGMREGATQFSFRIITDESVIQFNDRIQGTYTQQLDRDIGDFVLKRADGLFAYQLAIVADDHDQKINSIVRGRDLLVSTPRQIYLQQLLAMETPDYAHVPLVMDDNGNKLSKSDAAHPVDTKRALETLNLTLDFLGQAAVEADTIDSFWQQATRNWLIEQVPK
ncbi:tRNA glutamyl-Q(34) synthetase GluQRS [Solemya velum gill symbiont]|uniref:tRNA glutamyl-Q(34) synthetase GluQRS n=1 Tax=Solemya velum gill symbiont TaxID=2340 RepID=UPI0009969C94|nr:tRNA glutamyl-Q(34) synthetase GluQRS [Solemya velum gill symbiont]OOY99384.1 tRNA glutamyl-Q(34) synthetase GluQRS [Solemya velum gill symbiont]OOZ01552.1 tRNA glutamyl-Q(34) synthetase GluQRS [Solemya velum gill symbiont]OOZ03901.1 tRNA glutamyl-Q(34) synthetase GluQRS [Solemya velum gill symbiont]OOZ06128.1 tRNA glutamyl-Q(34) synthetase GluQRS [Solemya velum gill symbiont]OOZ08328.1 tRNA glutamyl-Q(34) synthetase GluQRS [Solemya velum gill symbiont]